MHDEAAYKDRAPFDVSTIEEDISTLIPRGASAIPRPALRRYPTPTDRPSHEPAPNHAATVEESAGTKDATDALISTREATHGSFDENARVWQSICDEARRTAFLNDRQRLAYAMIALKLARLLQNPRVKDHWDDIAGYARLGADGC